MSQRCQYMHSPYQSLVAATGSSTGSDHSLDVPVVCRVSSNVHDHVGQTKSPGSKIKLSQDRFRMLQLPMPGRTVNGLKTCIVRLDTKAKQGGAMESNAAK
eukprot:1600219-Pleurochrysis_carterae.AAC.1